MKNYWYRLCYMGVTDRQKEIESHNVIYVSITKMDRVKNEKLQRKTVAVRKLGK